MFFGPNPKSTWPLCPGDLPSEADLAREPRLRGLENNPAFRLLLSRRRAKRRDPAQMALLALFIALALFSAVLVSIPSTRRYFQWLPLAINLIIFWPWIRRRFFKDREPQHTLLPGITYQEADDLRQCGAAPEEIAIGIWGSFAGVRLARQMRTNCVGMIAVGALVLLLVRRLWPEAWKPLDPKMVEGMMLFWMGMAAHGLGGAFAHSHFRLQMAAWTVAQARDQIQGRVKSRHGWFPAMGLVAFLLIGFFGYMIVPLPADPLARFLELPCLAALTVWVSFRVGSWNGRRAGRNADKLLARAADDIAWLLEHARQSLHERLG